MVGGGGEGVEEGTRTKEGCWGRKEMDNKYIDKYLSEKGVQKNF